MSSKINAQARIETDYCYADGGCITLYKVGDYLTDAGHTSMMLSIDYPSERFYDAEIGQVKIADGEFSISCNNREYQDDQVNILCHVILAAYEFYKPHDEWEYVDDW